MSQTDKYGRCLHAQISLGTTSDDRFLPNGYVKVFAGMDNLIMTEKLDGQNTCFNKYGVFARSHVGSTTHKWDKPMRERWELIKNDLGDVEIFGENMYGLHSIGYNNLESYYYVFAIREGNRWKSWEEVKEYAALFDFPTVPEIPITTTLKDFYKEGADENKQLDMWLKKNLGMSWVEYADTAGELGGYNVKKGVDCCEGLVIRNADGYVRDGGEIEVYPNEFNNLFKLVRAGHVQDGDVHWTKTWKPTKLTDYAKYGWYGYEYMNNK